MFPGKVRAYGIGMVYQRFHWKNSFTSVVATPFLQFILGYCFEFFNKRLYFEPAYALKYWPVNTNFPKAFAQIERGASKHTFEPSINFGFKF